MGFCEWAAACSTWQLNVTDRNCIRIHWHRPSPLLPHYLLHCLSCSACPWPSFIWCFPPTPSSKKEKKKLQTNKRKQTKIIQPCHTSFPSKSHHVTAVLAQMEGAAYNETNSCFRFATTVQGKCVFVATLTSLRAGVPDQWPVTSLVLTGSWGDGCWVQTRERERGRGTSAPDDRRSDRASRDVSNGWQPPFIVTGVGSWGLHVFLWRFLGNKEDRTEGFWHVWCSDTLDVTRARKASSWCEHASIQNTCSTRTHTHTWHIHTNTYLLICYNISLSTGTYDIPILI